MKNFIVILISLLTLTTVNAQNTKPGEYQIKTSAECGTCKKTLENTLNYTKGIKYAELDVNTKILTVAINEKKISLDQLKQLISNIGYDADEVPANTDTQRQLPACCQPGGMNKL